MGYLQGKIAFHMKTIGTSWRAQQKVIFARGLLVWRHFALRQCLDLNSIFMMSRIEKLEEMFIMSKIFFHIITSSRTDSNCGTTASYGGLYHETVNAKVHC